MLAFVRGGESAPPRHHGQPCEAYPTLVTANWCPLSRAARSFWAEAANAAGRKLRILDASSGEGVRFMAAMGIHGVPCLVLSPATRLYGLEHSRSEAASILKHHPEVADAH